MKSAPERKAIMLRRCAWCRLILGQSEPLDEAGVTHGICLPCADRMLEEFRQTQVGTDRPAGAAIHALCLKGCTRSHDGYDSFPASRR
jgi:hypothetical protein